MKKNKFFKKALSVFMAAVTMFTMIGSSGLTAFAAGEQTAVYIVEFPRSGDANSGANWGNSTMSFMNGWSMPSLRTMHMRAIGSYTGQVCYCIEPGNSQHSGDRFTARDDSYWDNFPGNGSLSGDEIKTYIGRILQYGYNGNMSVSWYSQNESDRISMSHALATQILIWETVVGERDSSFNKVGTGGKNAIWDMISTSNPLYTTTLAIYDSISSCSDKEEGRFEKTFEIIRYFITPKIEEYYLDLSSRFNADRYSCYAFMKVRNIHTGDEYDIWGTEKKEFHVSGNDKIENGIIKLERFEHKNKLKYLIDFLSMKIDKQVRVLKNQYDDSKNYGIRTTAMYENGRIMFISESFNYRIPELPMYIMIEDNSLETKISISKRSMFLNRVLGKKNYKKIYNNNIPEQIVAFESVQEIENYSEWFRENSYIKKTIVSTCEDITKSIGKLKESIKNKHEFIYSTELIEGEPEEFYLLCKSLKLVKEFAFKKYDEFYFSSKEKISYTFNGQVYTITREDVKLAAQLGMKSADEMCLALERVGCIANLYEEI